MSLPLVTLGVIAPSSAGGGGGSGPSGTRVPFTLRDDDGVLQAGVNLTGDVEVSIDGGETWQSAVGDPPHSTGGGAYYYELDNAEIASPWVLLKIAKTGYQTVIQREDINDPGLSDVLTQISNSISTALSTILGTLGPIETDIDSILDTLGDIDSLNTQLEQISDDVTGGFASAPALAAQAVVNTIIEGSHTLGDLMRGIIAALVAKATDVTSNTIIVRNLANTKTRWTITKDTTGRLTVTPGDLT